MTLKLTYAVLAFLILSSSVAYGQTDSKPLNKIYLQLASGPTSHGGYEGSMAVQAVFRNDWTATVSFHDITMNPKTLPDDYKQGYTLILFFPIPDGYPETDLTTFSLTAGKLFRSSRKFWLTTEAGVSLVKGDEYTFRPQHIEDDFFHIYSNYSTSRTERSTVGALLKADATWAFASFAGLGVGAFAHINGIQSSVGGEFKVILGWMNRRK